MIVTRTCVLTGKTNSLELPITEQQLKAYEDGALVQNAFPNLDDDQREFILHGILPGTFGELCGYEYDEPDYDELEDFDDDEDIYDFETDAPF